MPLHAIVTAGGSLPRNLRKIADSPIKALLPVGGKSLLDISVAAALEVNGLGRIAVVGGADVKAALPQGAEYVREGEGAVDNIYNSFKHLGGEGHDYLIISPDLPFLTAAGLQALIEGATGSCEIGLPLVSAESFLKAFPGAPNKFELLDGRRMTLGSCSYFTGPALKSNVPLMRDMYNSRKYPWRMAIMLGASILFAYVFGKLKTKPVEERFSRLSGAVVKAIEVQDAGVAFDIDDMANYEFAVQLIEQGKAVLPQQG